MEQSAQTQYRAPSASGQLTMRLAEGAPTQQALESLVKSELARAQKLVEQGVEKKKVYAELIKNGAWTHPFPKGKPRTAAIQ